MAEEVNLDSWPPIEGRYVVGNKKSPVAVCTNATVSGIELEMEKVAICGKTVTENIGIEKMIKNIVSNPYIRFLILCGKPSKGHFVSQAIISLIENGIAEDKRIIGAKGNMPYLRGIDESLIKRFREQVTPINLIGEINSQKIMEAVKETLSGKSEAFQGKKVKIEQVEEIEAKGCDKWIPDPKGFFVVLTDFNRKKIIVEHYNKDGELQRKIVGDSANDISKTVANLDLIGDFEQTEEHSMYLARELQKAEIALKNNLVYEQDKELKVKKDENKKEALNEEPVDEYDWHD